MSFFAELQRRNVVRVGLAYAVVGWVLAQIAEFAFENFGAPEWALKTFVVVVLLGLPLALFFAWAFEMTPDGIKREKDVDRSQSIVSSTGRKLDFIIIGVMAVAIALLLFDRLILNSASEPPGSGMTPVVQTIAVLPFVNMSDDEDYFSDGLSEELLNLLAKIPELKVAGRTSSFAFKGRNDDFRVIGDALKVAHVLEGSVRRSGDTLRVTAQLIKVDDGYHIWSETYDRKMEDIFAIQDDVAGKIVSALELRLSPPASRATENTEAYAIYLEVLATSHYFDGDISKGIALLDKAIELDPGFAKAYERKAMLYWLAGGWTMSSSAAQSLVYQSAIKALELDPTLVVARSFSISAEPNSWSWVREIEAIEAAVEAAPNDLGGLDSLAYDFVQTGYFADSLAISKRMIDIDPLSPQGYGRAANALSALGRHEEATANWNKAIELSDISYHWYSELALISRGEDEKAIAGFEELFESIGLDPADVRPLMTGARDSETGKAFLTDFVENAVANAANHQDAMNARAWFLVFGYLDEYWNEIEEITAQSDSSWTDADLLEHACRVFAATHCAAHPRAMLYAEQQHLTELWDVRGAPDNCRKTDGKWSCQQGTNSKSDRL
jgi:TolB-like protein